MKKTNSNAGTNQWNSAHWKENIYVPHSDDSMQIISNILQVCIEEICSIESETGFLYFNSHATINLLYFVFLINIWHISTIENIMDVFQIRFILYLRKCEASDSKEVEHEGKKI